MSFNSLGSLMPKVTKTRKKAPAKQRHTEDDRAAIDDETRAAIDTGRAPVYQLTGDQATRLFGGIVDAK